MSGMDDRSDAYENKFAHDEELRFKAEARRNKLLGLWAADLMGKQGDEAAAYAKEVVLADFEEAGDNDVFRKIRADFDSAGVQQSDHQIRRTMDELMQKATEQILSEQCSRMRISERLRNGETSLVLWSSNTDPQAMEAIARSGVGTVVLDAQHGAHDEDSLRQAIGICRLAGMPVMVRLPIERHDMASRSLDFGADGVIAPMINNADDAAIFASVCKYPPLGERSWGPTRDLIISGTRDGETYLNAANAATVALAMVETREAYDNIDAIIATDGIDGVFVGPSDFSVNWSGGDLLSPKTDEILDAIRTVAEKLRSAGKIAGIYASSAEEVKRYHDFGYRLITATADLVALDAGIAAALEDVRQKLG